MRNGKDGEGVGGNSIEGNVTPSQGYGGEGASTEMLCSCPLMLSQSRCSNLYKGFT